MVDLQHFPPDMSQIEIDKKAPRRCLISGLFEEKVDMNGNPRSFYTYIKPNLQYNSPCIVIVPPLNTPILKYIEDSFWLNFAEKHNVFLHFLVPHNNGWNFDGTDADYMNKVYIEIQSRKYYVTIQDNIYAVGIGEGATIAQQAVMKMSSEWAGLATFGDLDEKAVLNAEVVHGAVNTGKTELNVTAAKAQVPVWMAWSENTTNNANVCDYWKKQNDADTEKFANQWADEIYFPSNICKKTTLNEEKIAQIRITNGFTKDLDEDFFTAVWNYISLAYRHRGFGKKMLRNRIDANAYGFTKHTMEWQGFNRLWYEYVPESVKQSGEAVPLVVCMHGRGGTAESFLSLSGMSRVAEERNFIAIFPEASVYQQRPGGLRNILLWSGAYHDEQTDDVGFILKIIEEVKQRENIDATRVYACGQSSGGMMSSQLALKAPEVFAAVSPWSAIVNPEVKEALPTEINPQVPYMFLFGESDWLCVDRKNGEMEYHVTSDIADFLKNLMNVYGLDKTPSRYTCGEISYYTYSNKKQVPMLIVGTVKDMSHANYPKESWIAYDQFLAKFSKTADGTLLYMGKPIE